jgi:hypothetical protein
VRERDRSVKKGFDLFYKIEFETKVYVETIVFRENISIKI